MNATYYYILELDSDGNAIGGEWFFNKHPNYVYGPRQGDEILWLEDRLYTKFEMTPESLAQARKLSADKVRKRNSPLRAIVKYLIEQVYNDSYIEDNTDWVDDPDILDRLYGIIRQDSSIPTLSPIKDLKYETRPDGTRVRNETYEDGVTIRAEITGSKVLKYITRPPDYKNITVVDIGPTIIKPDGTIIRNETMSDGNIHRVETTPDGKVTRYIIKIPNLTNDQPVNPSNIDNQGGNTVINTQINATDINNQTTVLNNNNQPITPTETVSPPTEPDAGILIVPTEPFGTLPSTTTSPTPAITPSIPDTVAPQVNNTSFTNQPRTETRADGTIVRYEPQPDGTMHRIETYPDGRIIRFIIRPARPSNTTLSTNGQSRTEVRADGTIITYEPQLDGSVHRIERYQDGRIIRFIHRPAFNTTSLTKPNNVTSPTTPSSTTPPTVSTPTNQDRTEIRPDGTIITYQTQPDGTVHRIERYPDGRVIRFVPRNPSTTTSSANPTSSSTTNSSNPLTNSPPSPQTNDLPPSTIRPDGTIVRFEKQPDGSIHRLETSPNGRTIRYYTTPVRPQTPTTTSSSQLLAPTITFETRPDGTRVRIETYPNGRVIRYIIRTVRSSSTNLRSP